MTTLFNSAAPVKPATPRRFGSGLLASHPVYRTDHSASDASWWAAESARLEDARIDRLAGESAALDLMEAGISCC